LRAAIPAVALAAVALALVIGLRSGPGPTITGAARLAYAPAISPPPRAQSATLLDVSYGGVTYPNYERQFDAIPTGQRIDRLGGRAALTVFYRLADGARLSYTVFSGEPVPLPRAARSVVYDGVSLRVFPAAKLAVVTLVRFGRTCVLAAPTTPDLVLALAAAPIREQTA
jgi:hypothetical protein